MKIFTFIGIALFFCGLAIMVYSFGSYTQMVITDYVTLVPPGFQLSLITSIVVVIITLTAMFLVFHRIEIAGVVFMFCGTFFSLLMSAESLNVLLDTSKPVTRTFLVNNIDIKPASRRYPEKYYALVQSWWDYTQYLPVSIPKSIYDDITPRETSLDITVREGAFGMPYFVDVTISDKQGAPLGLVDFN